MEIFNLQPFRLTIKNRKNITSLFFKQIGLGTFKLFKQLIKG